MSRKISFDGLIIPIFGRDCLITEVEGDLDGNEGLFHPHTFTIELRADQTPDNKMDTLYHELGHALINRIGIPLPEEVEEMLVTIYAGFLTETFDVDVELLKQRFGELKK